jgi:LysR family glycine cleavage system transcriptional activator
VRTSRALADFRREDVDRDPLRAGTGPRLDGELLVREELFPVASPALFGGRRMPATLAALAEYPLLHDVDAHPEQPWMSWRAWFERAGLDPAPAARGLQFTDSLVQLGAAVAGLGLDVGQHRCRICRSSRGQLIRVTQESWRAEWRYFLVAPAAHFKRPTVRAFVDWALEEARTAGA